MKNSRFVGRGPGLVVMGDDSCLKGRGFESWRHILDGHFFTLICCKNCIVCLKRQKINEKEAGVGPFLKNSYFVQLKVADYDQAGIIQCLSFTQYSIRLIDLDVARIFRKVFENVQLLLLPLDRRQRVWQVVERNWNCVNIGKTAWKHTQKYISSGCTSGNVIKVIKVIGPWSQFQIIFLE